MATRWAAESPKTASRRQPARKNPPRGTVLKPVATTSAVSQTEDRLLTAIALGEFSPGERLPAERQLASYLRVSRDTVREALGRLVDRGLLEVRRGRTGGAFVLDRPVDGAAVLRVLGERRSDLSVLSDFRQLIEGLIARTAAARRGPEDVRAIGRALEEYEEAGSMAEARTADARLHQLVAKAAGNPRLGDLSHMLLGELSVGYGVEPFTPDIYQRALPQHRDLVEAVRVGDPDRAFRIASEHFGITADAQRMLLSSLRGGR